MRTNLAYDNTVFSVERKTIPANSNSFVVDLFGQSIVGIGAPFGFSGALLTVQTEIDGTWVDVLDRESAQFTIPISQAQYVKLNPVETVGLNRIKMVSNATQVQDVVLSLFLKGF
jgi:hypothetical protein